MNKVNQILENKRNSDVAMRELVLVLDRAHDHEKHLMGLLNDLITGERKVDADLREQVMFAAIDHNQIEEFFKPVEVGGVALNSLHMHKDRSLVIKVVGFNENTYLVKKVGGNHYAPADAFEIFQGRLHEEYKEIN